MNRLKAAVALLTLLMLAPAANGSQTVDYDAEIREIAGRSEVRRAFEIIMELEPRTHADLIELTEIPAPPFGEENRARRFAEMVREAGADSVTIDAEGNVIAERRGTGTERVVALAAHLDTVFPEGTDVTVRIEGNKLMAPGIGDDSRGLVLVLTVLRAIVRAGVRTDADLLFIATVGEEGLGDLRGVKHLFGKNDPRIDSWIAVDGGGSDRILHQGIGSHRYRVTFKGPGGHSWGAFGLVNPAHALARAIHLFDEAAAAYVASGPRTSYNIGRIGGGTSVNSIPHDAWLEIDMRSVSPERLDGIDALFQNAVAQAITEQNDLRRHGALLTVDLDLVGDRPSGAIDPETPIVQRALAATRFFGIEPRLDTGSTDSNVPIALGLPAITIGRGGIGDGAHSLREWWANENGYIAIQKALLIVAAEAGMVKE